MTKQPGHSFQLAGWEMSRGAVTRAGECAYRFVANLFLNPRVIEVIAEYWLQNHLELSLQRGTLEPRSASAVDMACHLIACVYQGVDDIVLVGQGSLAVSNDSPDPRYIHYLNFISPAGRDFSFALPVRGFLNKRTEPLLASLIALYVQNEEVWRSASPAATLGEHLLMYFRAGPDMSEWRLLYSPLAVGLEIACRVLMGLRRLASPAWFCSETGGQAFLRSLLEALSRPRFEGLFAQEENDILVSLQTGLGKMSRLGASERMAFACHRLMQARREVRKVIARKYDSMRKVLNRRYCLDDTLSLPWEVS